MQTVRQKWQLYKTYQRLQRLWEEYQLASTKEEWHAMAVQLDQFLEAFQDAYHEQVQFSLRHDRDEDGIADASALHVDRMVNYLHHQPSRQAVAATAGQIDFYHALINRGLDVSELILQASGRAPASTGIPLEERYRRVVLDTPNLTTRLLVLLGKLRHTDTTRRALRVILALGQEDDAKLEMGRQQGFRKLCQLVSSGDRQLTAEVIHTIRRLTETQSEARMRAYMAEALEDGREESQPRHLGALLGGTVGDRVTSLVSDVRDIMSFELGRVLYRLGSPANSAQGAEAHRDSVQQHRGGDGDNGDDRYSCAATDARYAGTIVSPSPMAMAVAESPNIFGRWRSWIGLSGKEGGGSGSDSSSRSTAIEPGHATEQRVSEDNAMRRTMEGIHEPTENAKAVCDVMDEQEFLRQQGAVRSLTELLRQRTVHDAEARLELIEILCKLLMDHPASQLMFKQLDGYKAILQDLHRAWTPAPSSIHSGTMKEEEEEEEEDDDDDGSTMREDVEAAAVIWYQDYFNLLFTLSLGFHSDLKVTNIDAFTLLFSIATECSQLEARRQAINCIQGLDIASYAMVADPVSVDAIDRATALEKAVDRSVVWQYVASITGLLEYFSVLLSEHNLYIMNEYTRMLMQANLPSYNIATGMVLRSVGRLLTVRRAHGMLHCSTAPLLIRSPHECQDQLARQQRVDSKFLNIYLQLLRRSYHLTASILDAEESPNAAEWSEHSMAIDLDRMGAVDPVQRAMAQEQYLSLLQIVGMLIEATGRDVALLKVNQGFRILHDAVALSTVLCWRPVQTDAGAPGEVAYDFDYERLVCDMAMWLLRECLLCQDATRDGVKWLVKLLKLVLANLTSTIQVPWTICTYTLADADTRETKDEDATEALLHRHKTIGHPFRFTFGWFQVKICQLLSSTFRRSNPAKRYFGELGGIEALLTILSQTQDLDVATCALITVGDLFAGGEETKQLLGETFGYEGFMELVLSSRRPLDRLCCQILLEVATVGNVVRDLGKMDSDEEPFGLSSAVIPFIAGLLAPTVLYEAPLPLYGGRRPGFRIPVIARCTAQGKSNGSHRATPTIPSRPSSVFSDGNRRFKDTSSGSLSEATRGPDTFSMFSARRPRSIAGPLMDMRTEALILEDIRADPHGQIPSPCWSPPPESSHTAGGDAVASLRPSLAHRLHYQHQQQQQQQDAKSSQVDPSVMESEVPLAHRLIGVVFRDRHAAHMAFKLLFRLAAGGPELQRYYFELLVQLLHVNPQNQQLICLDHGLEWIIRATVGEVLVEHSTALPPASLASLVSLVGSHDIGPSEAALLLNAIYDPLRVATANNSSSSGSAYDALPLDHVRAMAPGTVAELQHALLLALLEIASRLDPVHMFSFDGAGALLSFPLDKLPGPKSGYTLACWLRVAAFLDDDTGLLCYEDAHGCFFELYFRRLAQSNRCCLCVRTQQHPMPPEDFVFYEYDFTHAPGWHHVVLAHSRQDMTLFVDGQLVQTCNTFHYPRTSSRDRHCTGVVGRRGGHGPSVPGAYFCGQLAGITFYEGQWNESVARRVFDQGPRTIEPVRSWLPSEHREALAIDPKACFAGGDLSTAAHGHEHASNGGQHYHDTSAHALADHHRGEVSGGQTAGESGANFTRSAGCSVHVMRKLADVIHQVGGPQVCFPMMETSLEYQLIGLNIIVCLLLKSPENRRQFAASSAFHVLRHLLVTSRWPLTMDHFELLLEIACDGRTEHGHRVLVHWDGMDLYTDMLVRSPPETVQLEAIHLLVNVLLDLRKNLCWWREGPGLAWLFDALRLLPASQHQFLFRLLDAMMEDLTAAELGQLLDFIAYEKRQYLEHKCEVLDLLLRHATWNARLVELLHAANGLTLLISFLDLPSERFRLLVLKLLGVLMSSNVRQTRTTMAKVGGFDAMWLFLAPFPVTADLVQTLLGVALNFYRCDQVLSSATATTGSSNSHAADPLAATSLGVGKPMLRLSLQLTDPLVYPELVRLLLELLRACDHVNLIVDLLADVKRMLTEENMATLWEYPWTEWFAVFLQDRGVMEKSNYGRIATMVHAIAQRLMVFDMARRVSVVGRLKGAVAENETFQRQLIDDVLAYYERRPCLDAATAPEVLKNLAVLYRHLDEYQPPNAAIYLRFAGCINQLACHNAAATRNIMKTMGLFHIRDALIINLLQADLSTIEQVDVFGQFSFEMLADQPRFREAHGLLLLMRAFHLAEPTVRPTIARILLAVFRPSAECRRVMAAILEDPEVIRRFFTVSLRGRPDEEELTRSSVEDEVDYSLDDGSHYYATGSSGGGGGAPSSRLETASPMTLAEFIAWYFQSDPDAILRRGQIEQRIETLYAPVSMVYRRAQERVFTRRHKRIEQIREKQLRHAAALNRALADLKAKGKQRMDRGAASHQQRMGALRDARQARFNAGAESWRLRVHNTSVQALLPRPQPT
ncbi:hypothetical protein SYNPS1DRAFT_26411 [Syncephalis pseudoplumigaleata]|uniref:DUF4704 domain-containing protein n=1 Tax=Syncephalis pseudoplumigaleata TaxID=1712513 RepID=A0A4P9Z5Z8_9FUNG|nr:hypothetical protein SYNPS1DRAFT_26411 [Syncephalis pseudoplumigaleata]|eukprot:RKP27965.1 hypothetical protein SYNPS1DRAFT_26411 [Syncephalis pseudoplumigaleata]